MAPYIAASDELSAATAPVSKGRHGVARGAVGDADG